ncbi:MAG: hypothetical protein OEM02_05565 [Desulfobulbaceae bacterium]|nr:hypothetical protein [Desulfobulbaceae bacterium]
MERRNIYIVADQAVVSGGNFLAAVLLARFLTLFEFGIFGICLVVVLFFVSVQVSLLITPLYTFLPKIDDEEECGDYISDVVFLVVVVSFVFSLVSCVILYLLPFISEQMKTTDYAILASVYIFFRLQQECIRRIFFAHQSIEQTLKADVLVFSLQLMLIILIWFHGLLTLNIAFVILGFSYALGTIYGIALLDPSFPNCGCVCLVMRKHWNFAKWLVGGAVLSAVVRDYVILSVGLVLSPMEVGKMRAAERLGGLVGVVLQLLENVIPVRASRAYNNYGKLALYAFLKKTYFQLTLLALGIIIFFSLFSETIMSFVFGEQFSGIGIVLIGYVVTNIINVFRAPLNVLLRTFEKTSPIFWGILLGAVLNVGLAHFLVERYGLIGAVLTLVASSSAIFLWLLFWSIKVYRER